MRVVIVPLTSSKLRLLLALLLVSLVRHNALAQEQDDTEQQLRQGSIVAGYLPDYRSYIDVNATVPHLTDLILFSIKPHSRGLVGGCCLESKHYELGRQAKALSPSLKLWVTVGGGGRTEAIPGIVQDPEKRSRLIKGMARLAKKESMDGIDLDGFVSQSQSHLSFLEEASEAWHKEGLLVSLTLHPNQVRSNPKQYELVDRIHLMAYDIITETGAYHAEFDNVKKTVLMLVKSGCPRSKIVLGFPGYGRHLKNPQMVMTFAEIYDKIFPDSKDDESHGKHTHQELAWESPKLVEQKVHYAKAEKLGGVFIWELGQDKQIADVAPGGLLLEAASKAMRREDDGVQRGEQEL